MNALKQHLEKIAAFALIGAQALEEADSDELLNCMEKLPDELAHAEHELESALRTPGGLRGLVQ